MSHVNDFFLYIFEHAKCAPFVCDNFNCVEHMGDGMVYTGFYLYLRVCVCVLSVVWCADGAQIGIGIGCHGNTCTSLMLHAPNVTS